MSIIAVKLADIRQETPTVKLFKIDLLDQEFNYKAGQWIDCYAKINGVRKVAGYSLASSPTLEGFIELAVKTSDNPVTTYLHEKASVGDILYIDGGQGEVFYDSSMADKVILAAAGIGVAPLMGILRFIDEATESEVTMFQAASTFGELIYHNELSKRSGENPRIRYHPSVTREEPPMGVESGRITLDLFDQHEVDYDSLFYLSGPGEMIPELRKGLRSRGVDDEKIKFEVWW
jgi:glycine betaine catabolism B